MVLSDYAVPVSNDSSVEQFGIRFWFERISSNGLVTHFSISSSADSKQYGPAHSSMIQFLHVYSNMVQYTAIWPSIQQYGPVHNSMVQFQRCWSERGSVRSNLFLSLHTSYFNWCRSSTVEFSVHFSTTTNTVIIIHMFYTTSDLSWSNVANHLWKNPSARQKNK